MSNSTPHSSSTYSYVNGERKIIDPVVAKLKEKRRLEKQMKEAALAQKKGIVAKQERKKPKATIPLRTGPTKQATTSHVAKKPKPAIQTPRPKPTKMKFSELMKKASNIDNSKLSINIKPKSKSPDRLPERSGSSASPRVQSRRSSQTISKQSKSPANTSRQSVATQQQVKAPLPSRGPSHTLAAKLKKKTHEETYSDDDDLGSFIASDEDEVPETDYDRDQIWAMFNRGKKRSNFSFDDYDSDDMEATGAEILDEELRSKITAEREDRKELEAEQRRAEMKKKRKLQLMRQKN